MVGGLSHVNGKKLNLTKKRRVAKQQHKMIHSRTAKEEVEKANAAIPDILSSVVEATAKKREMLLLSDKPYSEKDIKKVKLVTGIRPGRMGKHGVAIQPTRINKKKVKKLIKQQISKKQLLEVINSNDVEME
jgi:hypothetical protein